MKSNKLTKTSLTNNRKTNCYQYLPMSGGSLVKSSFVLPRLNDTVGQVSKFLLG